MASYRFNILDIDGKPSEHHQDEYPSDLRALQRALDLRNGHVIEVWQGERWVAAVGKYNRGYRTPTK